MGGTHSNDTPHFERNVVLNIALLMVLDGWIFNVFGCHICRDLLSLYGIGLLVHVYILSRGHRGYRYDTRIAPRTH